MKKIIAVAAILCCAAALFAQTGSFDLKKYNGFTLGGGANVGDSLTSGFIEAGFSWFSKNTFSLRNYVKIQGGGFADGGVFGIREQLQSAATYAVNKDFAVRGYGFADFGFFVFVAQGKPDFFSAPYFMEVRGGGGVELLFQNGGFFIEAGGGGRLGAGGNIFNLMDGVTPGFGFVSIGGRHYFNKRLAKSS